MEAIMQLFGYINEYGVSSPSSPIKSDSPRISTNVSRNEITEKRKQLIGNKCSVFYSKSPLIVDHAFMQYVYNENGQKYIDCISNVQHVGHCHPKVVEAISIQLATSTCNIRFLSQKLTDCATAILKTLPPSLDTVFLCNSGSEANDLALQLARDFTKRSNVFVLENAYHGHITTAMQMSPYKFDHGSTIRKPDWVHVVPAPDAYRGMYRLEDDELKDQTKLAEIGKKYSDNLFKQLQEASAKGKNIAAIFMEALQSCGGQIIPPIGYFRDVAKHVHEHGGLVVIDEVQTSFGRIGDAFWAHHLVDKEFVPDILTMGKSIGNGFPVAAVVTRKEIAQHLCGSVDYFNTYGGNPAACAAILAVLNVIEEDNLVVHSDKMGILFEKELKAMQEKHKCIGDVRGFGMFWGVELVTDRQTREPATEQAAKLVLELKQKYNVLLSADGPYSNVLKFKPPMCFDESDLEIVMNCLDKSLCDVFS